MNLKTFYSIFLFLVFIFVMFLFSSVRLIDVCSPHISVILRTLALSSSRYLDRSPTLPGHVAMTILITKRDRKGNEDENQIQKRHILIERVFGTCFSIACCSFKILKTHWLVKRYVSEDILKILKKSMSVHVLNEKMSHQIRTHPMRRNLQLITLFGKRTLQ